MQRGHAAEIAARGVVVRAVGKAAGGLHGAARGLRIVQGEAPAVVEGLRLPHAAAAAAEAEEDEEAWEQRGAEEARHDRDRRRVELKEKCLCMCACVWEEGVGIEIER